MTMPMPGLLVRPGPAQILSFVQLFMMNLPGPAEVCRRPRDLQVTPVTLGEDGTPPPLGRLLYGAPWQRRVAMGQRGATPPRGRAGPSAARRPRSTARDRDVAPPRPGGDRRAAGRDPASRRPEQGLDRRGSGLPGWEGRQRESGASAQPPSRLLALPLGVGVFEVVRLARNVLNYLCVILLARPAMQLPVSFNQCEVLNSLTGNVLALGLRNLWERGVENRGKKKFLRKKIVIKIRDMFINVRALGGRRSHFWRFFNYQPRRCLA